MNFYVFDIYRQHSYYRTTSDDAGVSSWRPAVQTGSTRISGLETDRNEIPNAKYMSTRSPSQINTRSALSHVDRHRISRWRPSKPEVLASQLPLQVENKFKSLHQHQMQTQAFVHAKVQETVFQHGRQYPTSILRHITFLYTSNIYTPFSILYRPTNTQKCSQQPFNMVLYNFNACLTQLHLTSIGRPQKQQSSGGRCHVEKTKSSFVTRQTRSLPFCTGLRTSRVKQTIFARQRISKESFIGS